MSEAQASPPEGAKTSRFEDFFDIWYQPSAVFARREPLGFWTPLIVVSVLLGAITLLSAPVMQPILDAEFNRGMASAMAKNPQLTPEMLDRSRAMMTRFLPVIGVLAAPFRIFVFGLAIWLLGKLVRAKEDFATALGVAAFASLPRVLEGLISGVQAALMDPASLKGRYSLSLSPARFLDPNTSSALMLGVLGRIDVFAIWVLVIGAIGLAVTGKISGKKAALTAILGWVLGTLPALLAPGGTGS